MDVGFQDMVDQPVFKEVMQPLNQIVANPFSLETLPLPGVCLKQFFVLIFVFCSNRAFDSAHADLFIAKVAAGKESEVIKESFDVAGVNTLFHLSFKISKIFEYDLMLFINFSFTRAIFIFPLYGLLSLPPPMNLKGYVSCQRVARKFPILILSMADSGKCHP